MNQNQRYNKKSHVDVQLAERDNRKCYNDEKASITREAIPDFQQTNHEKHQLEHEFYDGPDDFSEDFARRGVFCI